MRLFTRKTLRVDPSPFIITFHHEADGGPAHLMHLLNGYSINLCRKGWVVAHGLVIGSDEEYVTLRSWDAAKGDFVGPIARYNLWDGTFDEVMYL